MKTPDPEENRITIGALEHCGLPISAPVITGDQFQARQEERALPQGSLRWVSKGNTFRLEQLSFVSWGTLDWMEVPCLISDHCDTCGVGFYLHSGDDARCDHCNCVRTKV